MTSDLRKSAMVKSLGGALPPKLDIRCPTTGGAGRHRDFSPLMWSDFFDECVQVKGSLQGDVFNVYTKGTSGPLLLMLHGGGYSGLTWAALATELCQQIECRVVAPDLRGHGDTKCMDEKDYSNDRQCQDILDVLGGLDKGDKVVLIGHSMGGALAVRVASRISSLAAMVVIDVVEGSAMEALTGMRSFLLNRPHSFNSVEDAIQWCVRSGTVRNLISARVSMPSQLKLVTSCEPLISDALMEEEPETEHMQDTQPKTVYTWRIDLLETETYWDGWFRGLSAAFLDVSVPKLLLLAGVDRLDKDLTVGQMQGKFQMVVLPKVGHAVHEDSPANVAQTLASFLTRHKITVPLQS